MHSPGAPRPATVQLLWPACGSPVDCCLLRSCMAGYEPCDWWNVRKSGETCRPTGLFTLSAARSKCRDNRFCISKYTLAPPVSDSATLRMQQDHSNTWTAPVPSAVQERDIGLCLVSNTRCDKRLRLPARFLIEPQTCISCVVLASSTQTRRLVTASSPSPPDREHLRAASH